MLEHVTVGHVESCSWIKVKFDSLKVMSGSSPVPNVQYFVRPDGPNISPGVERGLSAILHILRDIRKNSSMVERQIKSIELKELSSISGL